MKQAVLIFSQQAFKNQIGNTFHFFGFQEIDTNQKR